jgi:hypothetical protein
MTRLTVLTAAVALLAVPASQEKAKPAKEHEWLKEFAGVWTSEAVFAAHEAGKEPTTTKGSATARMFGDFWLQLETKGQAMGGAFTGLMTVGWDADKKKFVGTWIDTVSPMMWHYTGALDGQKLPLEAEGPSFSDPKKKTKFRDTLEIKGKDLFTLTSSIEQDGKWTTYLTVTFTRAPKDQ